MDPKFVTSGDAISMKVTTTREGVHEGLGPRLVSITGTAGLTQTKPSGPLGQFQVCLVKPLVRFLTVPYVRAQRILQFSRTVYVFHMQSVYIARQALHLVIILNDLVDEQEGPNDEQYQERIDLEDELIELLDAMREWGAHPGEGLQIDHEQGLLKINQQYAQFFRERYYFHNARNSADDFIYGKLVAYDRKTINFRKWQYSHADSTSMDVGLNGSKTGDEGNTSHGSEAFIESVTSSPDSSGVGVSAGQEILTHPVDESSAGLTRSTASSVSHQGFYPGLEGRLFTAHDSPVGADCEVHPTARLLYDSLPQYYRDVFSTCRMYPEKHLDFVNYLRYLSLNYMDENSEPSERELIKCLGIPVPTEDRDKKKWQCGVIGCEYKGTLQHLVSHLRTKSHIGIPIFACTRHCNKLFYSPRDRGRHVKQKKCLKSCIVKNSLELHGSTRSLRGVQDTLAVVPRLKVKSRVNQQSASGNGSQTPPQSVNDPVARQGVHYDPMLQLPVYPSFQHFGTPIHLTHAYNQTHSNFPTTQDGSAGMHRASHVPPRPDLFPTMSILPTNNGGMHTTVIMNNNHIHSAAAGFQPTINPQFTHASLPINSMFDYRTGLTTYYYGQDPGRSSTASLVSKADNLYGDDPPQASNRRPQDSRQPPQYVAASSRSEAWGVTGTKEEEEGMRVDLESGVVAMDVTP